MKKADFQQLNIRLPSDLVKFLDSEIRRNCSSKSSEVVRALRERAERLGYKTGQSQAGVAGNV